MTDPRDMSPEQKEAWHQAAESQVHTFRYDAPVPNGRPKQLAWLVRRPAMHVAVQRVYEGGENNLHYHTNVETIWWVLKGKCKFYGPGDVLIGEFNANEGVVTPRYSRYWFENGGDEDLELIQIAASDMTGHKSGRTDLAEKPKTWGQNKHFDEKSKEVAREADAAE